MALDKENLKALGQGLDAFTNSVKTAEKALGDFFALGSRTPNSLGPATPALNDLKKAIQGVGQIATGTAGAIDAMIDGLGSGGSAIGGFSGALVDLTSGLVNTLPEAIVGMAEVVAGAFDGPTKDLRAFDASIFEVGKRFGDPIQSSKDFADAIKAIPASEFGQALSLTRDELSKFYSRAAQYNLTQEMLNETVSTGIGETNLLAAAYAFGESAAMGAGETMRLLDTIINKQGVSAGEAAEMLGVYSGVAKEVGIAIDDVASTLNSAVSQFSKLGISADFGAPILEGFGRVVKDMGLGIDEATSLTQGLASALGGLTTDYANAYVMFQRGGLDIGAGGGALGASIGLQAELLRAEQTGDQAAIGAQLVGAMKDTLASFGGGNIVTVSEAAESPELQTQFYTQQQLLMNQFGIRDQASATRTLELLAEIDDATRSGNMEAKEELQKQLENEVEGRDKTLDVLEQINREIAAQSNLLAIAAREDLEALSNLGFDIAKEFASPKIAEAGSAGVGAIESGGDSFQRVLDSIRSFFSSEGAEGKLVQEVEKRGAIAKAAQESTPDVNLTNKELSAISARVALADKQISKEEFKAIFKEAIIEGIASGDRDLSNLNVTIDFANEEMRKVFKGVGAAVKEISEVGGP